MSGGANLRGGQCEFLIGRAAKDPREVAFGVHGKRNKAGERGEGRGSHGAIIKCVRTPRRAGKKRPEATKQSEREILIVL